MTGRTPLLATPHCWQRPPCRTTATFQSLQAARARSWKKSPESTSWMPPKGAVLPRSWRADCSSCSRNSADTMLTSSMIST